MKHCKVLIYFIQLRCTNHSRNGTRAFCLISAPPRSKPGAGIGEPESRLETQSSIANVCSLSLALLCVLSGMASDLHCPLPTQKSPARCAGLLMVPTGQF